MHEKEKSSSKASQSRLLASVAILNRVDQLITTGRTRKTTIKYFEVSKLQFRQQERRKNLFIHGSGIQDVVLSEPSPHTKTIRKPCENCEQNHQTSDCTQTGKMCETKSLQFKRLTGVETNSENFL